VTARLPVALPARRPVPDPVDPVAAGRAERARRQAVRRTLAGVAPDQGETGRAHPIGDAGAGVDGPLRRLDAWEPDRGTVDRWRARSRHRTVRPDPTGGGAPPDDVAVHDDRWAGRVAAAHGAAAVTIGEEVFLGPGADDRVLAHELTHVAQRRRVGPGADERRLEAEAERASRGEAVALSAAPAALVLRHPAIGVLRRAGRWLAGRSTRTISKHIARHGRNIAGRSVHSVFRIPRKIRSYVRRALDDARHLAATATRHGPGDVIEGGGVRILTQATRTPGKYRTVVERTFSSPIGTRGERILRIVIDQSGRLVTAFPVDRFLTVGLTGAAASVFTSQTAEAAERVRSRIEAEQERERAVDPVTWLIDLLVAPSVANEGEQLWLDLRDIMADTVRSVIAEIEEAEQMTLGPEQREAIEDLVSAAIGTPLILEDPTMWDDTEP
jgi:hypothetical protein